MEHLENDMDDLFQKAGELYPLKTTGSDWDAVAGKLENEIPGEVHDLSGPAAMRSRRKGWLLLLLLIPMSFGYYYYSANRNPGHQKDLSVKSGNASADQKKKNSVVPESHSIPVASADNHPSAASGNTHSASIKSKATEDGNMNGTMSVTNKRLYGSGGKQLDASKRDPLNASGGNQLTAHHVLNPKKQTSSPATLSNPDLNTNNPGASKETETGIANKSTGTASSSAIGSVPKAVVATGPAALSAPKETAAVKNNTDKTESTKKTSQDNSPANKKNNTSSKQSKGFYVGLYAGPDVSTVKFQAVNNLGLSIGALVGYRFNDRLSVETGLIWDKKYYYSKGEYYKGVSLPPNTTVDGKCSMFEIPVAIRFDFATSKNHGFFAKTGLSSYLMTSENYTFNYPGYSHAWKNDSLQNNIFSILQVSGGYERAINDKTKFRVEPYVKIPLQGIGKGAMPIASFGIYIGITRSFR
ncbi:MAG TPA: outer membrane beta-barrel protein [Puia sp.]|nr:outer membrane beta-barrel protein [Puia sp.]